MSVLRLPSVGVGLNLGAINLDYAFTSLQTQANPLFTHVISLRVNLKSTAKKETTIPTTN